MISCANIEVQGMLPDLLHGTLGSADRARVDSHVAGCELCREEMRVLKTVMSSAVFAPNIDASRIAQQIPPYRRIEAVVERPVRPRFVSWLVAAALAIVVAGGGSVLMTRGPSRSTVAVAPSQQAEPDVRRGVDTQSAVTSVPAPVNSDRTLALAADLDGLSDGSLEQLMNDMTSFDGLPAAEPEPAIPVDSVDVPAQD